MFLIIRKIYLLLYRTHVNYIKDITLNREGEVLSTPLYTADERQFRRSLRELLEKEE